MNKPKNITTCNLECLVMPNGEVISLGKNLGQFEDFEDVLVEKKTNNDETEIITCPNCQKDVSLCKWCGGEEK